MTPQNSQRFAISSSFNPLFSGEGSVTGWFYKLAEMAKGFNPLFSGEGSVTGRERSGDLVSLEVSIPSSAGRGL